LSYFANFTKDIIF